MNCIVLQNADGGHLGFLVCNPAIGNPSGDCMFMVLPFDHELINTSPAKLLLQRRQAGESSWKATDRDSLSVVVHTPAFPDDLFIELNMQGTGQWGVGSGSSWQVMGKALLTKSPEPGWVNRRDERRSC